MCYQASGLLKEVSVDGICDQLNAPSILFGAIGRGTWVYQQD